MRSVHVEKKKSGKSFQDILSDLKKGIIADLYVLEGEEEYLKGKLCKALETLLIEPASRTLDLAVIEPERKASQDDLIRIRRELGAPPFLSKRRLVIVRKSGLFSSAARRTETADDDDDDDGASRSAAGGEREEGQDQEAVPAVTAYPDKAISLIDLIRDTSGTSCLVFCEDKVDRRQKQLVAEIEARGVLADITKPDTETLRIWVRKEFEREGIGLPPDTIDALIGRNDGNLLQMSGEIAKLSLYAHSVPKNRISLQDLDAVGIADLKGSIFDLIDALSGRRTGEAYRILEVLISRKQPVQLIFFMLSRHIRQLIAAKDLGNQELIRQKMKVLPFVAAKLLRQSGHVSSENLESIYRSCHEADLAVKTSRITDRIALDVLIAESATGMKA